MPLIMASSPSGEIKLSKLINVGNNYFRNIGGEIRYQHVEGFSGLSSILHH
jgi:hypothetical protein